MARARNKLTDRMIRAAKEPGWYGDGDGLYLRVLADGKRWVFVFRWDGARAEMGLGPFPEVGLAQAREGTPEAPWSRDWARAQVRAGRDPRVERRRLIEEAQRPQPTAITFRTWATEIAPEVGPKAEKAAEQWLKRITEKTGALADMEVAKITTEDVLSALKPYWNSRPDTARRIRGGIERVLDAAKSRGHIQSPWENPARWRGHLENLLRAPPRVVNHHRALPYAELPALMSRLRERADESMAVLALQWTILTVARTSETIFAVSAEVDRKGKLWVVPAARMKGKADAKREHRVPLSDAALAVLDLAEGFEQPAGATWLFPSTFRPGKPLSTAAMDRVLEDMGLKDRATVHGMRSAFSDWAHDCTNFTGETIEAALAHVQGDEVKRAYRRSDALEKRRKLMEAWAGYLTRPAGSNVRSFNRPA